jgi:hypothetical protein
MWLCYTIGMYYLPRSLERDWSILQYHSGCLSRAALRSDEMIRCCSVKPIEAILHLYFIFINICEKNNLLLYGMESRSRLVAKHQLIYSSDMAMNHDKKNWVYEDDGPCMDRRHLYHFVGAKEGNVERPLKEW